jgi:O-antigen/teichoic acid export membrane protein
MKAAQSLVGGPSQVLIQASGSIGLPEASHSLEHGGWEKLRHVARWITLMSVLSLGLITLIVFVAGSRLLGWIYGPEFAKYATTAKIVAIAWLVPAFSGGAMLILKVTRNTRTLFNIGLVTMVILMVGTVALASAWGINGAATADVIASSISVVLQVHARRRVARQLRDSIPDVADDVEHHARAEPVELDR